MVRRTIITAPEVRAPEVQSRELTERSEPEQISRSGAASASHSQGTKPVSSSTSPYRTSPDAETEVVPQETAEGSRLTGLRSRMMKSIKTDVRAAGVLLCTISAVVFVASIYVMINDIEFSSNKFDACSDDDQCQNITPTFAGGYSYALSTLVPLSSIPFLVFLMVRYVALRLYLRN